MTDVITVWPLQSARMRAAGVGKDFKENPNLRDNWTDAEGYYSKCCLPHPGLLLTRLPAVTRRGLCVFRGEHRRDAGQTL